jgi:5-methyltetrahydropteroyltriglutamate--homocysteine methyltransferase
MREQPLRTTVIGSYPWPGWLEFACSHLHEFGADDRSELQDDAVIAAVHDQVAAGLDVVSDGEQTRLDFNLSFYGFLDGIDLEIAPARRFGPPAHDQRSRHRIVGELGAPAGLGVVAEYERLCRLAPPGVDDWYRAASTPTGGRSPRPSSRWSARS